jgi:hypothetical protein
MLLDILKQLFLGRCLGMLQRLCGMSTGRRIANPAPNRPKLLASNPATSVLCFTSISSVVCFTVALTRGIRPSHPALVLRRRRPWQYQLLAKLRTTGQSNLEIIQLMW